jgi:hypothetical protein
MIDAAKSAALVAPAWPIAQVATGIQLFEWNDLKTGWDGKIEDKDAVDGIYFFIIQAKDITSKNIKTQGTFSLIR